MTTNGSSKVSDTFLALSEKLTDQLGVCVKTKEGQVIEQNTRCKSFCGDQTQKICEKNCLASVPRVNGKLQLPEGFHLSHNSQFDGRSYDSLLISTPDQVVTLLYLLDPHHQETLEILKKYELSPRELEIVALMIRGDTNAEMAKKLFISRATLRTHLNNIYKKLPPDVISSVRDVSTRQMKK